MVGRSPTFELISNTPLYGLLDYSWGSESRDHWGEGRTLITVGVSLSRAVTEERDYFDYIWGVLKPGGHWGEGRTLITVGGSLSNAVTEERDVPWLRLGGPWAARSLRRRWRTCSGSASGTVSPWPGSGRGQAPPLPPSLWLAWFWRRSFQTLLFWCSQCMPFSCYLSPFQSDCMLLDLKLLPKSYLFNKMIFFCVDKWITRWLLRNFGFKFIRIEPQTFFLF